MIKSILISMIDSLTEKSVMGNDQESKIRVLEWILNKI